MDAATGAAAPRGRRRWAWWLALAALAVGASGLTGVSTVVLAQEEAREVSRGRELFRDRGNCPQCHGWHGNGAESHMGNGPSLRITLLDRDALIETLSCGRPGFTMPFHVKAAYTEAFACYGFDNKEDLEGMMLAVGVPLRTSQIEDLADFILAEMKGFEVITFEYCERYYGVGSRNCDEYRTN